MHEVDFKRLDLNLLRVLLALTEAGSVTEAGEKLGLAQSSVSHALARLRERLNDPLFVRTSQGIQATKLANDLAPAIAQAFKIISDTIEANQEFDPLVSTRTFTIVMTGIGEMLIAPRLIVNFRKAAPNVCLVISTLPSKHHKEALESGRADLVVGQVPDGEWDLLQRQLSEGTFRGFARSGHPILVDPSLENFFDAFHLVVGEPDVSEPFLRKALGSFPERRKIALRLTDFLPAGFVLSETDLVAVLPSAMSEYMTSSGSVESFPLPFETESSILRQFWHPRSTNDQGHKWLRCQVAAAHMDAKSVMQQGD